MEKRKKLQNVCFAQDIWIRNSVTIPFVSPTIWSRPPFTTAKKTWNKVLPTCLLKYNPKIISLSMKKKNAQIKALHPQIWGLEIWSRKCFYPHPTSTPHSLMHLCTYAFMFAPAFSTHPSVVCGSCPNSLAFVLAPRPVPACA